MRGVRRALALTPAACTYAFRNILARKVSTVVTTTGVMVSVTVFVVMSATAEGIRQVGASTGSPRNLVVFSAGASSAEASYLDVPTIQRIRLVPGVERDANGDVLASVEFQIPRTFRSAGDRAGTGGERVVTVRGVTPRALEVHEGIRLAAGRFPAREGEVLVGSILARKQGLRIGEELWLGSRRAVVSGLLDGQGQVFSGEIWIGLDDLRSSLGRNGGSSVVLRAASEEGARELARELASAPGLSVNPKSEPSCYEEVQKVTAPFAAFGNFIALIMGFGAVMAGMNTLYAAMSRRTRELGTLRALGFGSYFVGGALLLESVLVGLIGGVAGALLALLFDGFALNLMGLAFEIDVQASMLAQGSILALLVGFAGGALPARAALRLQIIQALRQA